DGCVNVVREQGQGWMCECCSGTGTGVDVDGCVNVVQEQGQGWMCERRSTCTILNFSVPPAWFERWNDERVKHRADEYQRLKQAIGQHMWEQTCQLYPELQDKVEFIEVATPISNNHYIHVSQGEIYGLDHSPTRCSAEMALKLRPDTPVPGLYLTGQDICLTGFVGSVYSGVFTAGAVLGRYVIQDIWNLSKKINKKIQ
ncbi:hypothetical protein Bbelb_383590, partial [Branchiostoma belcheri]